MPSPDESRDAYCDGKSARRIGAPRSSCPHPEGTVLCNFWVWGWEVENDRRKADVERALVAKMLEREGYSPTTAPEDLRRHCVELVEMAQQIVPPPLREGIRPIQSAE